jgi:hypothetical protein
LVSPIVAISTHLLEQSLKVGKPVLGQLAGSICREHGNLCFQEFFNRHHVRQIPANLVNLQLRVIRAALTAR